MSNTCEMTTNGRFVLCSARKIKVKIVILYMNGLQPSILRIIFYPSRVNVPWQTAVTDYIVDMA